MSATKPSPEFFKNAVYLVDSSSYIFRAYYAIRQGLTAPDGTPTHATFGFTQLVLSLLDKHSPEHCVFIWDHKEKNFRHQIFSDYKANRSAPPEDLGIQIDNSKKFLNLLALPQLDRAGFEADDIIATLIAANPDSQFVIVTGDKDLLQLVGPNVWCLDTMKDKWSNIAEAQEKFGVEPQQIAQVQALSGDSVDNIPGAPGIGPKTATDLIRYYGSLEAVLVEADRRLKSGDSTPKSKEDPLKGKRLESVGQNIEKVRLSLQLVSLSHEAPVDTLADNFHQGEARIADLKDYCQQLGFNRLVERFTKSGSTAARQKLPANGESTAGAPINDLALSPSESQGTAVGLLETPSSPQGTPLNFKVNCLRTLGELEAVLKAHQNEPLMSLDTETFSLDCRSRENLVGLSFAFNANEGIYVPLRHQHGENLPVQATLKELENFLGQAPERRRVIFQNAKFDLHVLFAEGLKWPVGLRLEDTMVASFVTDPSQPHGMDELSVKYLKGYRPKSFKEVLGKQKDFSEVPIDEAAFYSAEDAVVTWALWEQLSAELNACPKLLKVYEALDRPLIEILFEMEEAGIYLDCARLKALSLELHKELGEIETSALMSLAESGVEVADDFNMGSPKQIAHVLFEKLGLPVIKKTKTGASTDVSVLEELAPMHPFPKALLEVRELSKLISTYVDSLPLLVDPRTQRLHTDFSLTVAATGRLSSNSPNLQNIPIRSERGRKIRESFSAETGHLLVSADYSQIELRLLAHMSCDENLVKAFREGADIHRRTAALILGKDESEINDDDRRMAKTINFGIIYGQTAFGLAKQLGIPRGQAQSFIDTYFKTYPGIRNYTEKAIEAAREKGYSETLTGRRRPMRDIASKNVPLRQFAERMAINTPLQGSAADLMKSAMIEARRSIGQKIPTAKLLLQVHDELLYEVPKSDAENLKNMLLEIMATPGLLKSFGVDAFEVPMIAEASIGVHWGEL